MRASMIGLSPSSSMTSLILAKQGTPIRELDNAFTVGDLADPIPYFDSGVFKYR